MQSIDMRKRIKQIAIVFIVIIGIAAVIAVAGALYVNTPRGQEYLQAKISTAMPGSMTWHSGRLSPLSGAFEVRDGLIKDPSNVTVAGFDRLILNVSWFSSLSGGMPAVSCLIEKPWTHLKADTTGAFNLGRAFAPPPSEAPPGSRNGSVASTSTMLPAVLLEQLTISDGSLHFETADRKSMIDLGDINLIARGDVAKLSGIISLHVGRGNIDSPNIHTGIDDVAVEAAMSNGRIDPLVARVRLPSVQANLSGSVTDITGTPSLRASAEGTVSLRELGRSLCLAPAMTGQVAVHLQIAGSLDNPEGHLRLDYGGGTILKTPVDRINLETWLADRLVSVNALTIHVAEGTVKGEGSIDLRQSFPKGFRSPERKPEAVAYALSLEGTGIHLDTLIRDGRRRSGIVNPSLSIRGTGVSLHDMTAHATLAVNGTGVGTGSPAIPVDLEVRGDAALRQGTAEVRQFTIRAGRTEADVHGSWNILSN
ncbi:MAG: hypothetical protein JW736_01260, partial [Deltaproteobacteria bacterium]|nr:hypothetical protein [Deltaproteobacteria bacterium]